MTVYMRHGDVFIIEGSIPQEAKATQEDVLEHGENGHYHRLHGDGFKILKTEDGRKYLRVVQPTDLKHEEHHTRVVPPGEYEVRRTLETDHMTGITRQLAD